jgi:hypothetical protein
MKTFGLRLGALCLTLISFVFHAHAMPAMPRQNTWVTDGSISAMLVTNGALYIAGSFTKVTLWTGGGVPVDATTGAPPSQYSKFHGSVLASVPDGKGGWFVGGSFWAGTHTNLLHLLADFSIDPAWQANATGGYVKALQLVGNTLFVGGSFTNISSQTRNRLAALDVATGTLQSWNPNADGLVTSLTTSSNLIFAGGYFTNLSGIQHRYLCAIDPTTGAVTNWNPNPFDGVETIFFTNNTVYAGGRFTFIGGQTRNFVGAVDATTGLATSWNPGVSGTTAVQPIVYSMAPSGNLVYIAGGFQSIGGQYRTNVAAVDINSGLATAWDTHADPGLQSGYAFSSASVVAVSGNTVYVGGNLYNGLGGQYRPGLAAVDATTGLATSWDPAPNMIVQSIGLNSNTVFVGGLFSGLGGITRSNAAAFDETTAALLDWNPSVAGTVTALAASTSTIYLGGTFTNVGGQPRLKAAAVDAGSGALLSWNPMTQSNAFINAIALYGNTVFAGGFFTNVAGAPHTNLISLDATTGAPNGWSIDASSIVQSLSLYDTTLYVGGSFTRIGTQTHRRIGAIDATTGDVSTWSPGVSNGVVNSISRSGNSVYLVGNFTNVSGVTHTNIGAVDATTGAGLAWGANTDFVPMYTVAATSNAVFVGGNFSMVGTNAINNFCALDPNNAAILWTPNPDYYPKALVVSGNKLYVGGVFLSISGEARRSLACYSLDPVPTGFIRGSAYRSGGTFNVSFTGEPGMSVAVQRSSNLVNWTTFSSIVVTNSPVNISDPALASPGSFYRLQQQ